MFKLLSWIFFLLFINLTCLKLSAFANLTIESLKSLQPELKFFNELSEPMNIPKDTSNFDFNSLYCTVKCPNGSNCADITGYVYFTMHTSYYNYTNTLDIQWDHLNSRLYANLTYWNFIYSEWVSCKFAFYSPKILNETTSSTTTRPNWMWFDDENYVNGTNSDFKNITAYSDFLSDFMLFKTNSFQIEPKIVVSPNGQQQIDLIAKMGCSNNYGLTTYPNLGRLLLSKRANVIQSITPVNQENVLCNTTKYSYSIQWYTQSLIYSSNDSVKYENSTRELNAALGQEVWSKYFNNKITCQVILILNGVKSPFSISCNQFYLGLNVDFVNEYNKYEYKNYDYSHDRIFLFNGLNVISGSIIFYEGDLNDTILRVYPTIPILCAPNKNCSLKLSLLTDDNDDLIRISGCVKDKCPGESCDSSYSNTISTDPKDGAQWAIIPTTDSKNSLSKKFIKVSVNFISAMDVLNSFWSNFTIPEFSVEFRPKPRVLSLNAYCTNDPHCKTFDSNNFEFQYLDGEYIFYQNNILQLWVHLISVPCASLSPFAYNYCIKGVYVQSIDDFVSYEVNRVPRLTYVDLSSSDRKVTSLVWRDPVFSFTKPDSIQLSQDATYYYITSHFGAIVQIAKEGFAFYIIPSKLDQGKVSGIFGNYNNNPSDDFKTMKNGSFANDQNAFFASYKVESDKYLSNGNYYQFSTSANLTQNDSDNNTVSIKKYCQCRKNQQPVCSIGNAKTDVNQLNNRRRKRDAQDSTNLDFNSIIKIPDLLEPLQNASNDSCQQVLGNDQSLKTCEQNQIINLNQTIENCKKDFQGTHVDIWPQYYLESLKGLCKFNLENDQSLWKETIINGTAVYLPPVDLINLMCPSNCSNNGQCVNGTCACLKNYVGLDCSINLSHPPVLKQHSFNKSLCDLRKENCFDFTIYGNGFSVDNEKSTISLKSANLINVNQLNETKLGLSNVYVLNSKILLVKLNNEKNRINSGSKTMFARLSYSNDAALSSSNATMSNSISLLIYDSKCTNCTDNFNCTIKVNTCFIDSYCYNDKEGSSNIVCDSSRSQTAWTVIDVKNNNNNLKLSSFSLTFFLAVYIFIFN